MRSQAATASASQADGSCCPALGRAYVIKPRKPRPRSLEISAANAAASAGDCTPQRPAPGVALDHRADAEICRRQRRRHALGGLATVEHQGQPRAARQRRQPLQLLSADDVVGDEDVVDAGVGHHLGLAELLAGDADGTELDLSARELRDLVRLDVRPEGESRCGVQ